MKRILSKKAGLIPSRLVIVLVVVVFLSMEVSGQAGATDAGTYLFNDSHFHLTNYVQKGTDIHKYIEIMGDKIGRSTLFGIPLQQMWSHGNSGDYAPTYY